MILLGASPKQKALVNSSMRGQYCRPPSHVGMLLDDLQTRGLCRVARLEKAYIGAQKIALQVLGSKVESLALEASLCCG